MAIDPSVGRKKAPTSMPKTAKIPATFAGDHCFAPETRCDVSKKSLKKDRPFLLMHMRIYA